MTPFGVPPSASIVVTPQVILLVYYSSVMFTESVTDVYMLVKRVEMSNDMSFFFSAGENI